LDLEHQQQLQKICRKAANEGHCVVIVLHDLNQAYSIADDVWLLEDGHIKAQGPAQEVMTESLISQVFKVSARRIEDSGRSVFIFG
jgi:iron complex transport system ATP-binding protein